MPNDNTQVNIDLTKEQYDLLDYLYLIATEGLSDRESLLSMSTHPDRGEIQRIKEDARRIAEARILLNTIYELWKQPPPQFLVETLDYVGNRTEAHLFPTLSEALSHLRGEPGDGWGLVGVKLPTQEDLPVTFMETRNLRGEQNMHVDLSEVAHDFNLWEDEE